MIRSFIAATALVLSTLPTVAIAASTPRVTVFNQGGYVADYQISYSLNGQRQQTKVTGLVVGKKRTLSLPIGSQNIQVRGQMLTGLFWEPKREIFNQSAQDGSCFKTFGTIFKGEWSRDCTADF